MRIYFLFSGSQKHIKRLPPHEWTDEYITKNLKSVQGALETAIMRQGPYNEVITNFGSR